MNNPFWLRIFKLLLVIELIQSFFFFGQAVLQPIDPKNAWLLGFSMTRWVLFVLIAFPGVIVGWALKNSIRSFEKLVSVTRGFSGGTYLLIIIASCWLMFLTPFNEYGEYSLTLMRSYPAIESIGLTLIETAAFLWVFHRCYQEIVVAWQSFNKWLLLIPVLVLGANFLLRFIRPEFDPMLDRSRILSFNPGAPFSLGQVFSMIGISFLLSLLFSAKDNAIRGRWQKTADVLMFLLFWAVSAGLYSSYKFICGNDRPGPYVPNNVCYPQVTDSVYSIGSHYIVLGRGVLNHWFTEKPFYHIFLAVGQLLFGPIIDRYLLLQLVVIAALPALMIFLWRRWIGNKAAIFWGGISLLMGITMITTYGKVDGINVYVENTELLTSGLLLLCCWGLFSFLHQPQKRYLLAFSGGILGVASMTRLNPLVIFPIAFVAVTVSQWKFRRKLLLDIAALTLGFLLVVVPGVLNSKDQNGNLYFVQKIENVIKTRYKNVGSAGKTSINNSGQSNAIPRPIVAIPTTTAIKHQENKKLNTTARTSDKISDHFFNNVFLSFAKLPLEISNLPMRSIIADPLWKDYDHSFFWWLKLSVEQFVLLGFNILVVAIGLYGLVKKLGTSGVLPLLFFLGYHLSNAFAKTSGGRYLEPVFWAISLYYAVGIFILLGSFAQLRSNPSVSVESVVDDGRWRKTVTLGVFGIFAILGMMFPLVNFVPDRFDNTGKMQLFDQAMLNLLESGSVTQQEIEKIKVSERLEVISGFAYHPRVYESTLLQNKKNVFELTILSKDFVFESIIYPKVELQHFTDGSKVILLGCKVRQKNFWGAQTEVIRTLYLEQLDNEKFTFVAKGTFNCD